MKALVYRHGTNQRSKHVAEALMLGLASAGYQPEIAEAALDAKVKTDVALVAHYGLHPPLRDLRAAYQKMGIKTVFCDLGYWGRGGQGKFDGHYRVVANGLHANHYMLRKEWPGDRFQASGFALAFDGERQDGSAVVVAGMSAKAAWVYGLGPQQYEVAAIEALLALTRRPILYRPKPSWYDARPITGTEFDRSDLAAALDSAWCVVSHHSNIAVDCVLRGVPIITTNDGVGQLIGGVALSQIENPPRPAYRQRLRWLNAVGYLQWTPAEIASGRPFHELQEIGEL